MSYNVFAPTQVVPDTSGAVQDYSINFLYTIFGKMNGVILPQDAGTSTVTMLGSMFQVFNATILAVGALMVVYVTVMGVLMTAHEGEFMGKNWNNIWIPIRTVVGIASMVPTSSGYSGIQIVMMWVIIQGIGAADTLWNTVLGYVAVVGPPTSKALVSIADPTSTLQALFDGLVCYRSAMNKAPASYAGMQYYCSGGQSGSPCGDTFPPAATTLQSSTTFTMNPSGACGTLTYCNYNANCNVTSSTSGQAPTGPGTLACLSCTAQITAIAQILSTFQPIADQLVQTDFEYNQFYLASSVASRLLGSKQPTPPSWVTSYCAGQKPAIPSQSCIANNLPTPSPQLMSAPNTVVTEMYWPYVFQPWLQSNSNFIQLMASYYQNQLGGVLETYIQSQVQNSTLTGDLATAASYGWIYAGAYYYTISGSSQQTLNASLPPFSFNFQNGPPNSSTSSGGNSANPMASYRNNYTAAGALLKAIASSASQSAGGTGTSQTDVGAGTGELTGAVSTSTTNTFSAMNAVSNGQGSTDPLQNLIVAGNALLWAAFALFIALLLIVVILGIVGNIDIFVLGSGAIDPVGPATQLIGGLLFPAILALIGMMISLGGTLSIYVPLIPYTIFLMGAISWLMTTIEAMVAGPLVSLGILSPSGRHDIMGKAEPALGFLFSLFLRPSLMIFGMIAAMLLSGVAIKMINDVFFGVVYNNTAGSQGPNPIGFIIFLMAYVSLIVSVLNKCFSAIHVIPERVLSWISITGVPTESGQEAVTAMKQAVEKGASATSGAMEKGAGTVSKAAKMKGQQREDKKEAAKADIKESKESDEE